VKDDASTSIEGEIVASKKKYIPSPPRNGMDKASFMLSEKRKKRV
jgi:hypothetical protein